MRISIRVVGVWKNRLAIEEPRGGGWPGPSQARVLRPREEGAACLAPQFRLEGAPGGAEGAAGSVAGEGFPLLRCGGPVLVLGPV